MRGLQFIVTSFLALATSPLLDAQAIDPSSVPRATRNIWCTNQKAQCPLLCTQVANSKATASNTCDPATLAYSCVCANGDVPNSSNFSQTIPFYECQTASDQCASNCGSDNACVSNCRNTHPCGASNPTRVNSTVSAAAGTAAATTGSGNSPSGSSMASNAATGTADSTGFYGAPASTSSKSAASSHLQPGLFALRAAEKYGLFVTFAGLFAGFALVL